MVRRFSATEARVHFGELLRQVVEGQQPVIVERGGKPEVVVISLAEYERLTADQPKQDDWWSRVLRARAYIRAELGDRELPPPEDVIRQMREERDAQLLDTLRGRQSAGPAGGPTNG